MILPRRLVALVLLVAALPVSQQVRAGCKIERVLQLPVTMVDRHPIVTAKLNGIEAGFIADSGAFYSMITPAGAAELKLKTYSAPWSLRVMGVGGEAGGLAATRVKDFQLAGAVIHNVEFLVGGGDVGGGSVGLLGQNVFRLGDVEYDLAHGVIRLLHEQGCEKANLAYWTADTQQAVSILDIDRVTAEFPQITGTAYVNGVKITVQFDTGADSSYVTKHAAERAGIHMDSPDVVEFGFSRGVGQRLVRIWVAPFASFKVGGEEIQHTRLRIGESEVGSADMLIGADFFLSHHVYVSSKQHKLFFTYNGGPVFNLASTHVLPAAGAVPPADAVPPQDAAELSRLASALAARGDVEHALADLQRACELAPDEPSYFYQRGMLQRTLKQPDLALGDFNRALALQGTLVPALLARADIELDNGDLPAARSDLEAVDRSADRAADVRLQLALDFTRAGSLAQALAQLDAWLGVHGSDSRVPEARVARCWVRTLQGQELAKALDDCNAALKRIDRASSLYARALETRGLVRLRLGDYEKSIADFDQSLTARPGSPWSLYGRGIDKLRRGMRAEAQADFDAATGIWPTVAQAFSQWRTPEQTKP